MTAALHRLDDLMHEKEVMQKWDGLFANGELREARQTGQIEWYALRQGPHYTEQQLLDYLETRKRAPCQSRINPLDPEQEQPETSQDDLNLKGNGSGKRRPAGLSIVTGMSEKAIAVASAAEALAQSL